MVNDREWNITWAWKDIDIQFNVKWAGKDIGRVFNVDLY